MPIHKIVILQPHVLVPMMIQKLADGHRAQYIVIALLEPRHRYAPATGILLSA